jgi:tetratricopeptide (TPR) repeat protein
VAKTLFYSLAFAMGLSVSAGGCAAPTAKPPTQQTFADKFSAGVKSGTSKFVSAVKPKKSTVETTLGAPANGKPSPNVFVAVAQMHERSNNFEEADAAYRKALQLDGKHLDALVGYARLEDRRSNYEAATRLYQRAMKAHPKDASIHNDLGLCYHRRGMLPDATRELKRAVDLDNDSKLYRNNLAAVYVEQGKSNDALSQLVAAHGVSVGHYNLGYLLLQKGDRAGALQQFQTAADKDSQLVAAQQWVAKLSSQGGPYAAQAGATAVAQGSPQGAYYPPQQQAQAYVAQRPQPQYAPPANQQYAPPQVQQGQSGPVPPQPGRY